MAMLKNKAGYTTTPAACRWAGEIFEVTSPFEQEQSGQRKKSQKKSEIENRQND